MYITISVKTKLSVGACCFLRYQSLVSHLLCHLPYYSFFYSGRGVRDRARPTNGKTYLMEWGRNRGSMRIVRVTNDNLDKAEVRLFTRNPRGQCHRAPHPTRGATGSSYTGSK
jgi:hypothetical protein